MAKKILGPGFFLQVLYPFKARKLAAFFSPWTTIQENGLSLLYNIISMFHSPTKLLAMSVEKGYSFLKEYPFKKAMSFSGSLLMLHSKTIHESGIL